MSRPTAALPHGVVRSGRRTAAAPQKRIRRAGSRRPARGLLLPWVLVGATVLVQIVYPLVPDTLRTEVTVTSVLVFCAAAVADAARVHGVRGRRRAARGGGRGRPARRGRRRAHRRPVRRLRLHRRPRRGGARRPRGGAAGLDDDGLARAGRRPDAGPPAVPVALVGGVALAAWDLFLDPQMVDAGHWTWAHPDPGLPLVPGVPLTNYAGWLVVVRGDGRGAGPAAAPAQRAVGPGRGALPVDLRVVGAGARRVLRPAGLGARRRAADGGAGAALRPRAVDVRGAALSRRSAPSPRRRRSPPGRPRRRRGPRRRRAARGPSRPRRPARRARPRWSAPPRSACEHGAEAGLALRVVVAGRRRVPAARRNPAGGVVGLDGRRPRTGSARAGRTGIGGVGRRGPAPQVAPPPQERPGIAPGVHHRRSSGRRRCGPFRSRPPRRACPRTRPTGRGASQRPAAAPTARSSSAPRPGRPARRRDRSRVR